MQKRSVPYYKITLGESERFFIKMEDQQTKEMYGKLKIYSEVTGKLAHSLSNIVVPIAGFSEIALQKSMDDELRALIAHVHEYSLMLSDTIKEIRACAYDTDKAETRVRAPHALDSAVETAKEALSSSVEIKKTGFGGKDTPEDAFVLINEGDFVKIITNLFRNADHAMEGKGTISVTLKKTAVNGSEAELYDLEAGDYVLVEVTDEGKGMNEETQASIFFPFFTTKPSGEATGLGLWSVYGDVKNMDGAVTVKSVPGEGTVFGIYLPVMYSRKEERD